MLDKVEDVSYFATSSEAEALIAESALIKKYKPPYFLHGHIHRLFKNDAERISYVNTTQVINCYGFFILEI